MKKQKWILLSIVLTVLLLIVFVVDTYNIAFIKPLIVSTAFDEDGSSWVCHSPVIQGVVSVQENGVAYMYLSGENLKHDIAIQLLDFQTVGLIIDGNDAGIAYMRYRKRFGKVRKFTIYGFSFTAAYSDYSDALNEKYVFYRA